MTRIGSIWLKAKYEDEEYAEGEQQEPSTEAPPSSTEGKKLVAGGVRPFRSNTDLLAALKRRRAQAAEAKLNGHSTAAPAAASQDGAEAPAKSSYTAARSIPEDEVEEQEAAAPTRTGRTFARRGGN
ncbi:hypothetical protein MSG28_000882 [Choristoneura fumiferana]|uniref:Uncharacterized protein n=1 Tax=Choristoneura fumiferana TaxID=7141 RepID=A0ACC0K2N7_CHOFU|nr:hypothetical protein MSG28_000882 [Choristoneura fumiferana]